MGHRMDGHVQKHERTPLTEPIAQDNCNSIETWGGQRTMQFGGLAQTLDTNRTESQRVTHDVLQL
eukprot:3107390-Pyramimonas_sp.AAC.2